MSQLPGVLLNPWILFSTWLLLWSARPTLVERYFTRTQALHYYPSNGDSIVIPIVANVVFTIVAAPFFALIVWLLVRRSVPQHRRWLVWSRERWVWSTIWTVVCVGLAGLCIESLVESIRIRLPLNAVADVLWCTFWLAVRGVVVSRLVTSRNPFRPALEQA